ncbi:hypothetical protein HHL17_11740 [Chitinophaga sp. G-6-1-13]|uniref:Uncharacterized protein n=1 Tax=Chitinophaga fulva TaxID=2728842 RepID=A0A848GJ24_9BACT|nr:hypothetical protein [Chitinophaga fulva]NML37867.1 hypothetical protein [Chitinophaga fulva]
MKTKQEILERISAIKEDAQLIEEKLTQEFSKLHPDRDFMLLKFLHKEKCCWESAIRELEWALND